MPPELALVALALQVALAALTFRKTRNGNGDGNGHANVIVQCPHGEHVQQIADRAETNASEIKALRQWRHDSASRFGVLELIPQYVNEQRETRARLSDLSEGVARIEGRIDGIEGQR